jgi:maleylacetoacetate isomerase
MSVRPAAGVLKLYGYYRSSAAYRVRIALNLKALDYEPVSVHLLRGEQSSSAYRALNPQGRVPALVDGERVLTQSLAIVEYLDERFPAPPLLPATPAERSRVRALAQIVACDTHPVNNLSVLNYLTGTLGIDEAQKQEWIRHWIARGLRSFEDMLAVDPTDGAFCHGTRPTLADCCLIPQLFNARRFGCPLDDFPTLLRIEAACAALPAFQCAAPERQPDAE